MPASLFVNLKRPTVKGIRNPFAALLDRPVSELRDFGRFPRTIHLYWDGGLENAPEIVRHCVGSWSKHNPGWEVRLLDRDGAAAVVSRDLLPKNIFEAHYADILRCELLRRHGGIWADATCLCVRPLETWLPLAMLQSDIFLFHRPGPDRLVSNWFIAAYAESGSIRTVSEGVRSLWFGRRRGPRVYFWFHYLFEHLALLNSGVRRSWRETAHLSAAPPHLLQIILMEERRPTPAEREALRIAPVQKLSFKLGFTVEQVESLMGPGGMDPDGAASGSDQGAVLGSARS